eukprot:364663-Chlamydomonas_euryale.AAC.9
MVSRPPHMQQLRCAAAQQCLHPLKHKVAAAARTYTGQTRSHAHLLQHKVVVAAAQAAVASDDDQLHALNRAHGAQWRVDILDAQALVDAVQHLHTRTHAPVHEEQAVKHQDRSEGQRACLSGCSGAGGEERGAGIRASGTPALNLNVVPMNLFWEAATSPLPGVL